MEDSTNLEQKLWIHWNMTGEEIIDKTKKMIEKSITLNKKILDVDFNNKKDYENFISFLSDDLSSFTVFHSLQDIHCPDHFATSIPQAEHSNPILVDDDDDACNLAHRFVC